MKRSGFKRLERQTKAVAALFRPARWINPTPVGGEMSAQPKEPASRNLRLRKLAQGEECCVRHGQICNYRTDTTVWAHTNTIADQKGMGYKAHDHKGVFACSRCHEWLDRDGVDSAAKAQALLRAQQRTNARLHEISASIAMRPWKVTAARWAIEQLGVSHV